MDLLLRGGRLPGRDAPIAIGVDNGRIVLVEPDAPGMRAREIVDLDGRHCVPGLWDSHVHFGQVALQARRLDVSAAASAAHAAALVGDRLRSHPGGGLLIGFGFRDALWPDVPSRLLLDAACGSTPVVLVSGDLHCCWVNSAALARYGHDAYGSGVLREDACFELTAALGMGSAAAIDLAVDDVARAAAARGVVGVVDLEMDWNLDAWSRRIAAGTTVLRVDFGIYTGHLERAIALGLRSGDHIDGTGGLLRVGPYKVLADGSLNTRTAYCFDEYPGMAGLPGSHGISTVPLDELVALMTTAHSAGLTPAVHAIGDLANKLALDAFQSVGCRGSIEHAQLIADDDFARFAELGVTASVQPEHAMDDRDVADAYWGERGGRAFALARLAAAGATLAFGSDAPVAPLDPWVTIAAAVGRSRDGREPWHPEQAVPWQIALDASTRSRIAIGEVADIAVVELDPLRASADELRRMPVAATLLSGRFTHRAL